MSTHEEHIELFDQYLRGQLTVLQKESFERRLAGDQAFADDFRVHKILALGIRDHGKQELKAYLKEHGKKLDGGFNPRMRRMSFAVAASIILLVGIFVVVNFYITAPNHAGLAVQKEQSQAAPAPALQQDTVYSKYDQNGNATINKNEEEMKSLAQGEGVEPSDIVEQHEAMPKYVEIAPGPVSGYPTPQSGIDFEDLTVNAEKKLKDTLMIAELLFGNIGDIAMLDDYQKYEAKSFSKDLQMAPATVQNVAKKSRKSKKSPEYIPSNRVNEVDNSNQAGTAAADSIKLAETVVTDQKSNADKEVNKEATPLYNNNQSKKALKVEFWQSPLNFKGYKYTGNTLYLYGISQAGIKLYIYKDKTYMRNEGQVYLLEPCENGCPFKAAEDKTITEFILKQP